MNFIHIFKSVCHFPIQNDIFATLPTPEVGPFPAQREIRSQTPVKSQCFLQNLARARSGDPPSEMRRDGMRIMPECDLRKSRCQDTEPVCGFDLLFHLNSDRHTVHSIKPRRLLHIFLSRNRAGPGRKVKQLQPGRNFSQPRTKLSQEPGTLTR